jgi:N-acetylmuramoyl-L-alanine amidase
MKKIFFVLLCTSLSSSVWAQYNPLTLGIVIPEQDTVEYPFSRYRVAAHTDPDAQAFINGKQVQVYRSGAFVDMVFPTEQITPIEFMVVLDGDTVKQTRYLVKPSVSQPASSELVDLGSKEPTKKWFIQPNADPLTPDQWYGPGDVIPILAQATPGKQLSYSIPGQHTHVVMNERSPGVYESYHKVDPYDPIFEGSIEFSLKGRWFKRSKVTSSETVKMGGLPKIGVVNTSDAYLNIGLGSDRLGGAKYGSIYEGVELTIVGEQSGLYKVALSPSLHAWIPTRFVDVKETFELSTHSLSGNIRIAASKETSDLQGSDVITVSLPNRLPYIVHTELDPNRIVVDIFGATSNTNWKILLDEVTGIDEVRWSQIEDGRLRIYIDLTHKRHWGYDVEYGWRGQMRIIVKHPPVIEDALKPLKNRIIAVDAGHGGRNNGALGSTGVMEKDVALAISKKLEELLVEAGAKVVMTRTDDSYLYMSERAEIIRTNKAELMVSIHANSIGYATDPREMKGTGSFYKHMAYKPLAEIMYNKMRELGLDDYGLTGSFNFSLNAPTDFPNVLVETAFLSNPEEEIFLLDPYYQRRIAQQIVEGLEEYYTQYAWWPNEELEADK